MSRMFGERIHEFVLSVDIMTEESFKGLLALVSKYVKRELSITYFSMLEQTTINEATGLKTYWTTRGDEVSYTIGNGDGYASHSAFAFAEKKPIWAVTASRALLSGAADCIDLWNHETLPTYNPSSETGVRTSVMHPLRHRNGNPIGVVEFATERYVEPTRPSLDEVKILANVLSRAYQMFDVTRMQRDNTQLAMKRLEESMESESWTRLALPQMFVAFAGTSRLEPEAQAKHEQVVEVIRTVVGEFEHIVDALYWDTVEETGNITEQVIKQITESEFGLCYFSEPGTEGKYSDNPNVLFEAGMMQALTRSGGSPLRGWIPVREAASPTLPFDIAAERILPVNRSDEGELDAAALTTAIRGRVKALIAVIDDEA